MHRAFDDTEVDKNYHASRESWNGVTSFLNPVGEIESFKFYR